MNTGSKQQITKTRRTIRIMLLTSMICMAFSIFSFATDYTYTLNFNGNGNTGGNPLASQSVASGASFTVPGQGTLYKTGYAFLIWNSVQGGGNGGITKAAFGTISTTEIYAINPDTLSLTLYAQWSYVASTTASMHTLSYNGNGNTSGSTPASVTLTEGATTVVATNPYTRANYNFAGWNTSSSGGASGTAYANGANLTMGNADITLYAQWSPVASTTASIHAISYNGNGNTGGSTPASVALTEGATTTAATNSFTRTGYNFAGWKTSASGTASNYAAGATVTMGVADITLYAHWTSVGTHTLSYNGNSFTGGTVPRSVTISEGATTTTATVGSIVRAGYIFAGWNTNSSGTGTSYATAASITMGTSDIILYAKWTAKASHTLSYNGNGNSSGTVPANVSLLEGVGTTVATVGTLVRTGFDFTGWNTVANGTSTTYRTGSTITMGTSDIVLYAQWVPAKKTKVLSYNAAVWNNAGSENYIVGYDKSAGAILPISIYDSTIKAVKYASNSVPAYNIGVKNNFVGFSDVTTTLWSAKYIWYCSARSVINGNAGYFSPEDKVTRAQFVKMLASMTPDVNINIAPSAGFSDVASGSWYEKYINWAKANGIASGSNGAFNPDGQITREQMCKMLKGYVDYIGATLGSVSTYNSFDDQTSISTYATDSVRLLQCSGFISGKQGNLFDPQGLATRGESAKMIACLLRSICDETNSDSHIDWTL